MARSLPPATPKAPQPEEAGLRRQCLGFREVLGASLGSMGLPGTVIIGIPIVSAEGGRYTSLIFLAAMCVFLLVAVQVNVFANRIATHGSLYDSVRMVIGARGGAVAGWALVLGYAACVPAYLASIPYTLSGTLRGIGATEQPEIVELTAMAMATGGLASWLCIRNVALSTRATLAIDLCGLGLLSLAVGKYIPGPMEVFGGIPSNRLEIRNSLSGLALAMVCFTGFEAATVFGIEAKSPLTTVPKANLATVIVTGIVTVIASAAVAGAFQNHPPDRGENPFAMLIAASDLRWGLPIVLGAAALSWFGCLLACLNTGGRLLYTLALQGGFWSAAGRVHSRHATPHVAITAIAAAGMAMTAALLFGGIGVMDILVGGVTVAAAGFLTAYALVAAAAVVDRWRTGTRLGKMVSSFTGALTIASMLFAMVGLMVPSP